MDGVMAKRTGVMVLALLLLTAAAGCGSQSDADSSPEAAVGSVSVQSAVKFGMMWILPLSAARTA